MYLSLLKLIYKPKKPLNLPAKLTKNLTYIKTLGAFFILKLSTKPRNHVFFQKHTNSIMQ